MVRRGAEGFLADPCQLLLIPDAHRHRDDDDDGDLANPCQILLILNAHYGDDYEQTHVFGPLMLMMNGDGDLTSFLPQHPSTIV